LKQKIFKNDLVGLFGSMQGRICKMIRKYLLSSLHLYACTSCRLVSDRKQTAEATGQLLPIYIVNESE
jgi:hypothetical protein